AERSTLGRLRGDVDLRLDLAKDRVSLVAVGREIVAHANAEIGTVAGDCGLVALVVDGVEEAVDREVEMAVQRDRGVVDERAERTGFDRDAGDGARRGRCRR